MIGPHKVGHRVTVYCGSRVFEGTVTDVRIDTVELETAASPSRLVINTKAITAVEYPGATDAV